MALPTLSDYDEYVNILYYGNGGSGKSTDAAFLAKLGTIVYINAESGLKKRPLRQLGIDTDNILLYKVENYRDLDDLYWSVKGKLEDDPNSIKAVVFDSMTELQKKLMEDIIGKRVALHSRGGMEIDEDGEFTADRDEWGKMTEQVRRISRRFRDLDCHVVFVCLAKNVLDKEAGTGERMYRPMLTPAFAADLQGYVDVVMYTDREDGPLGDLSCFTGTCCYLDMARGKDRYGALPTVMPNPTMDRVIEYVMADDYFDHASKDPFMAQYLARTGAVPAPPTSLIDSEEAQGQLMEQLAALAGQE